MQDSIEEKFAEQDVVVFGLARNITSYEWLVDYVNERDITFDMLYHADDVIVAYGAFQDPTYVLIDKQGQIRLRDGSYYYFRISELISLIRELIEKP